MLVASVTVSRLGCDKTAVYSPTNAFQICGGVPEVRRRLLAGVGLTVVTSVVEQAIQAVPESVPVHDKSPDTSNNVRQPKYDTEGRHPGSFFFEFVTRKWRTRGDCGLTKRGTSTLIVESTCSHAFELTIIEF